MEDSRIRHCKYCGANIIKGVSRCPVCKSKINLDKNEVVREATIKDDKNDSVINVNTNNDTNLDIQNEVDEVINENQIKCSKCGQLIDIESAFCPNCGKEVITEDDIEDDTARATIFFILYIAFMLSIFVIGLIAILPALLVSTIGLLSCPKSKAMIIIFSITVSVFMVIVTVIVFLKTSCGMG